MSALSLAAAGPTGSTDGFPVRSCGGTHSASPSSRGTTHRWRYSTPGKKRMPSRPPPRVSSSALMIGALCSLVGWPAAKSTIVGGVASSSVTRLQRNATSSGPSPTHFAARGDSRQRRHRRGLERGAVFELGDRLVGAAVRHEHHILHR